MHCSSLHHLFQESLPLPRLKILNLSYSYHLSTTPDFKVLPNLERLVLENCTNLAKIDESIGFLERLVLLNLNGCIKLRSLPSTIGHLKALQKLYMDGCRELRYFPREMVYMEKLKVLDVDSEVNQQSALGIVSKVLGLVSKALGLVSRSGTKLNQFSLAFLPSSLTQLILRNCNLSDDAFLGNLSLPLLKTLDLGRNKFHTLPVDTFKGFPSLFYLSLSDCRDLIAVPDFPSSLIILILRNCNLSDDAFLGNLSLPLLENLDLSSNKFHTLPDDTFKGLPSLLYLRLSDCRDLIVVPEVPDGLEELELYGCVSIKKIPDRSFSDGFTFDDIKQEDIDMINRLKLFHKDFMRNVQLEMYFLATKITSPVKALREHGIFNFFYPGSEIPSWYKYQEEGSSISFVLEGDIIYALNICIVYCLGIPDVTVTYRGTTLSYTPSIGAFDVIEGEGPSKAFRDMLWLSCWNFYGVLFAGDEVHVTVRGDGDFPPLSIRSIGVHPVVQNEWDDWSLTPHSLLPPSLSRNHDSCSFRSTVSIS